MFTFHKLAFSHLKKAVFHYMSNAKMTVLIDIKSQEIVANSEKDIESYLLNSLKEYHSESSAIVKTFDKTVEGSKRVFEGSVKKSDRIDIFRDDKYIVVAPLTEEASMKYGADSHWCTSASGSGAWCDESKPNNENSKVGLIILIRRNYKMTPRNEENSELYYYLFYQEKF